MTDLFRWIWNYVISFFRSSKEYVDELVEDYQQAREEEKEEEYIPILMERLSPHHNRRPEGSRINGIIIHAAGEKIDGMPAVEFMEKHRLSYHAIISPDGLVTITARSSQRAWHAGTSRWEGQTNLNNTYLGYCLLVPGSYTGATWGKFLEAMDDPRTYTKEQYKSLAWMCRNALKSHSGIAQERIIRHSDVSGKDVRPDFKSDPGKGFNMNRLKDLID